MTDGDGVGVKQCGFCGQNLVVDEGQVLHPWEVAQDTCSGGES